MNTTAENVFLIETPLQLLNAVEAKHHFKLENSHLLIRAGGTGFSVERFQAILSEDEWARVRFVHLIGNTFQFSSRTLGSYLSMKLTGLCYDHQQWQNKRIIDTLANEYRGVSRLFLGNYLEGHVEYMRHFCNKARPETVYLLDDGTDSLLINRARHRFHLNPHGDRVLKNTSPIRRISSAIRRGCLDWDVREAEKVTFFSVYDLVPSPRDSFVKNNFESIRERVEQVHVGEEVLFLGQCLVDDGSLSEEDYLDYLSKVQAHFASERLVYVPHPRESEQVVETVKNSLGLEIRKLLVPIEFEVTVRGHKPKVLAGFFCSAIVNCHLILESQIKIRAFYIPPESLGCYRDLSRSVYEYFETRSEGIELVRVY